MSAKFGDINLTHTVERSPPALSEPKFPSQWASAWLVIRLIPLCAGYPHAECWTLCVPRQSLYSPEEACALELDASTLEYERCLL